jgi:hypothetical protein
MLAQGFNSGVKGLSVGKNVFNCSKTFKSNSHFLVLCFHYYTIISDIATTLREQRLRVPISVEARENFSLLQNAYMGSGSPQPPIQ